MLTQDKNEKHSSSPKYAVLGGFKLAPLSYINEFSYIRRTVKNIYSRVRNEPIASLLAVGDCAWVKYPAPWGELAKKKLRHTP